MVRSSVLLKPYKLTLGLHAPNEAHIVWPAPCNAMASFKGVTEKFKLTLTSSDGDSERVTIQLSLEGLKVLNQEGSRTMRSYALKDITRWQAGDDYLTIYTRTNVDLEERQMELTGDARTIRNALDTLTCCCMQLAEIYANTQEQEAASNLQQLVSGGGRKRSPPSLPSAESVEYWHGAEKSGWLQSQGDVMKTWRRRWFVLKQGYLFRFMGSDVSESTRPRGVVDLSQVQDVRDGRAATGKPNSIQLKTAKGSSVCYICDSETELVEWISAFEGTVAKIVKALAGVPEPEEKAHGSRSGKGSGGGGSSAADMAKQLERSLNLSTGSSSSSGRAMVSVIGYDGPGGRGGGGGGGGGGRASAGAGSGISSYSQISGIAGVAGGDAAGAMDDMSLNYGGGAYGGGGGYGGGAGPDAGYGSSSGANGGGSYGGYGGNGYGSYADAGAQQQYGGGYGAGASGSYGASGYGTAPAYGSYGSGGYDGVGAPPAPDAPGVYGSAPAASNGYGAGSGGYYQQQQAPAPQQQPQAQQAYGVASAPGASLIDQVPPQQPAYPSYYQPTAPAASSAPAGAPGAAQGGGGGVVGGGGASSGWQTHYAADGRAYYYNSATGATQWEAPPGV